MINRRFEEAIKDAVGEEQYFTLRKHMSYLSVMQIFDKKVKPNFNPNQQTENEVYAFDFFSAGLKNDPENNIVSGLFIVTR